MKEDVPMAHAGMAAQFDLQKQYYAEGKVFILQIESTLQCPQLCDYCYAGSTPESPQELPSATIRQLLDAAAASKVQMIDLLGGDPLTRGGWSIASPIRRHWPLGTRGRQSAIFRKSSASRLASHYSTPRSTAWKIVLGNRPTPR